MLRKFNIPRSRVVPPVSSQKSEPINSDFRKGMVTFPPNDVRPKDSFELIQDARVASIGNYKTRKGCDRYSVPIGEAVNVQETSTTGAADQTFNNSNWKAQKLTATSTGRLSKVDVRLKNDASALGTVIVAVYSDSGGSPSTLLARSSIAQSVITSSYAYVTAYFIAAPTITNATSYWVVLYYQEDGSGNFKVSSTTNSTNAKTSSNQGSTWSSASYSLNVKLYTATAGGVKGFKRVNKSNGTSYSFMAHGTNVYQISDVDGSTTSIDTGLDVGSTYCRFEFVNDRLYYVTGMQKPRVYDFTSASEVSAAPSDARSLIEHVGLVFYLDADDLNKVYFTNFADYETFTSTDFIYIPSPRSSDYGTAFGKLNGVLYPFTRSNKYALYGTDNATFRLDEAPAQKGTFSQESVVWDQNYIYFASDDGVYKFNGTSEDNIVFNKGLGIQDKWDELASKDGVVLELHNNRLYVWYTPNGEGANSKCFVWNTMLEIWESVDTNTYIGRAFARHDNSNQFYQASNLIGAVYYGEQSTNDYTNLGEIMQTEFKTHYDAFGRPNQLKVIRNWHPDFQSQAGDYSAQAGFAADFSDDVTFYDIPMQGTGYVYDAADAIYDQATYATNSAIQATSLPTYGEAYRWQRIYKHHAAREPIEFNGETLTIHVQRMR